MDAKKALKKLKKKAIKHPTHSAIQLMKLGKSLSGGIKVSEGVKQEVKDISHQALTDAVSELATPLNPLLSWFNEGGSIAISPSYAGGGRSAVKRLTPMQASPKIALARMPLKSPPCKRCPAMNSGLCKCAVKKFDIRV
ncbi:hypothetical protein [Photobacterium swingsii]|uniref:Uncharacterized protein n=1 Tax=Photobacterium swingsii TaxID=680026 RepID=A0A0J8Y0D5_9GAMM|nr:hypothetical protein [Photobacterium swingsii]KMV31089.1 hypothetical protein AB733_08900 [Photobacterium swingsii]PSW23590.1 hypothetical protein C9I94_15850 [Photobacterium swingsii]